jgi:hypothetical protein
MPPDHININHPERLEIYNESYRGLMEKRKLELEVKQLTEWLEIACRDLEAIFTRIERGETSELHYPDGRVFVIRGEERH